MENNKTMYKKKSNETFSKQAKVYDSTYNGKHAKKLYNIVVEKVNDFKGTKILDVGCGTGTILSLLSKNNNIILSGVDLSAEMLKVAKEKLESKAELKHGDSEELPWENDIFDNVLCTDSFHHYPNPEIVLKEMARVLKNKGHLIIGDPWMISPLRQVTNLLLKYSNSNSGDFKIYSKAEITKLLFKCGFNSVYWKRVNHNAFVLTAEVDK